MLPPARCALTAPFHPYSPSGASDGALRRQRYVFCATFLRVAPTGRYPAHCPAEFGLSSPRPSLASADRQARARRTIVWPTAAEVMIAIMAIINPSFSWLIPYCSSFLYRLLRGVPMTSAVFEMFQLCSRSLSTRNARSATSLNSRSVPGRSLSFSAAGRLAVRCRTMSRRSSTSIVSPRGHDDQPLDGVPQLADVSLPARLLHVLERRRREPLRTAVVLAAEEVGEVPDQRRECPRGGRAAAARGSG